MSKSIKVMEDGYRLLDQLEPERGHAQSRNEPHLREKFTSPTLSDQFDNPSLIE